MMAAGSWSVYGFYDPGPQRWINKDPLEDAGFRVSPVALGGGRDGDASPYAYLRNDPLNEMDPFGLLRFGDTCSPSDIAKIKQDFKDRC